MPLIPSCDRTRSKVLSPTISPHATGVTCSGPAHHFRLRRFRPSLGVGKVGQPRFSALTTLKGSDSFSVLACIPKSQILLLAHTCFSRKLCGASLLVIFLLAVPSPCPCHLFPTHPVHGWHAVFLRLLIPWLISALVHVPLLWCCYSLSLLCVFDVSTVTYQVKLP